MSSRRPSRLILGYLHNPLDPLEPSPKTLDPQAPQPTTYSTHNNNNIFFIPLDGNQIARKVASHSSKMETKCQTG